MELFIAKFGNGLRENLLISLVSKVRNKATLFGSKQVSGSTNIEVLHGNMYSASQVAEVFDGLKAATGIYVECRKWWSKQIAEGLFIGATYPTSHLMKVGKAKVVSPVNYDCVGIWNVESALDDGCGDEDIVIVVHEVHHNLLQLLRMHLSVSNCHSCIRHMFTNKFGKFWELTDAVVDEEDLPASAHLELDSFRNDFRIELTKLRLNWITVRRRRLDDTQIAGSHQAEL